MKLLSNSYFVGLLKINVTPSRKRSLPTVCHESSKSPFWQQFWQQSRWKTAVVGDTERTKQLVYKHKANAEKHLRTTKLNLQFSTHLRLKSERGVQFLSFGIQITNSKPFDRTITVTASKQRLILFFAAHCLDKKVHFTYSIPQPNLQLLLFSRASLAANKTLYYWRIRISVKPV